MRGSYAPRAGSWKDGVERAQHKAQDLAVIDFGHHFVGRFRYIVDLIN
jgi:hypothetical protein